jgi:hypothetical protein
MKQLFLFLAFFVFIGCTDNSDKTDNEKTESKIEIKTDSGEVKINESGITISSNENGKDSVSIKINTTDGIKVEGKDGKVELKTGDGGKIKIEKKGKGVNIQIKEKQ